MAGVFVLETALDKAVAGQMINSLYTSTALNSLGTGQLMMVAGFELGTTFMTQICALTIIKTVLNGNQATTGNGGGIALGMIGDDAVVSCNDATMTSNKALNGEGGFLYIDGEGSNLQVDIKGVTAVSAITGNQSDGGGGVAIGQSIGPMIFQCSNVNWDSNIASGGGKGGAVLLHGLSSGSNMTVDIKNDSTFNNNTASNQGGAISVESAGDFFTCDIQPNASNVVFSNNTANGGGAVSVEGAGNTFTLNVDGPPGTDVLLQNNSGGSRGGGAVYVDSLGDSSLVWLGDTTIDQNDASGDGGAVHIGQSGSGTTVWIGAHIGNDPNAATTLTSNTSTNGNGGGLFVDQATESLEVIVRGQAGNSIVIEDNESDGHGGAIALSGASAGVSTIELVDINAVVENRTMANGDGGMLWLGSLAEGTVLVDSCEFRNQTADGDGGAISIAGVNGLATVVVSDVVFGAIGSGNSAAGGGGGLHVGTLGNGAVVRIGETAGGISAPVSMIGNTATTLSGGGLWFESLQHDASVNLRNLTLNNNSAVGNGGGVAFQTAGDRLNLNATDVTLQLNHCKLDGGGLSMVDIGDDAIVLLDNMQAVQNDCVQTGGGISLNDFGNSPTINIVDLSATQNDAVVSGGGMWLNADGTGGSVTITNSVLSNNTFHATGGGLAMSGFEAADVDIDITANANLWQDTNIGQGGGVWIAGGPDTINIEGTSLTNNTADDGGGLYTRLSENTVANINATSITGNNADFAGGGVSIGGGQLQVMSNSNCSSNIAGLGGGIFTEDRSFPPLRGAARTTGIVIDTCDIEGNVANALEGGGLHIDSSEVLIRNTTIEDNQTTDLTNNDGAGLYQAQGRTRMRVCTISGNEADPTSPNNTGEVDGIFVSGGAVELRGTALCDEHLPALSSNPPYPSGTPVLVDYGLNDLNDCTPAELVLFDDSQSVSNHVNNMPFFGRSVIELLPGTYNETSTIDVLGRNVAIVGLAANGNASSVIIRGGEQGATIAVRAGSDAWLECVTITDGEDDQGNAHFGGVFVSGASTGLHIENCNIDNNNDSGLVVNGGARPYVVDTRIRGNIAGSNPEHDEDGEGTGGGIRLIDGDITIVDTEISGNQSIFYGGGVYVEVFTGEGESAILQGVLIDGNTSGFGGGLVVNGGSSADLSPSTRTGDPCVLSNNTASLFGGNIYLLDDPVVTMDSGSIEGGSAGLGGGGIYLDGVIPTLPDIKLTLNNVDIGVVGNGNSAGSDGGGAYVESATSALLKLDSACEFWDNTAPSGRGGHVYMESASPNDTVTCVEWPDDLQFSGGSALDGGTLAWNQGTLDLHSGLTGSINVLGSTATQDGGVIWGGDNVILILDAVVQGTVDAGGDGGAVRLGDNASFSSDGSTDFQGNLTAGADGGLLRMGDNATFSNVDWTIAGGAVMTAGVDGGILRFGDTANVQLGNMPLSNGDATANGGGVRIGSGVISSSSTTINDCSAGNGGGLWLGAGTTCTLTNVDMDDCEADTGSGGFLYINDGAVVNISGGSLDGGAAATGGGAMSLIGGATANCDNVNIGVNTPNTTGGDGGMAWLSSNGTLVLEDSNISNNTAGGHGGAISLDNSSGSLTLSGTTTMNNNQAGGDGGHIQFSDVVIPATLQFTIDAATVTMTNGDCDGRGGAIRLGNRTSWSFDGLGIFNLDGHRSIGDGGGVSVGESASIMLDNVDFTDCHTTGSDGGGIHIEDSATATITSTLFNHCGAENGGGGGVAAVDSSTVTLTSCQYTDCHADSGGALHGKGTGGSMVVIGSTFTSSFATGNGGDISMTPNTLGNNANDLDVSGDTTFTGSMAGNRGGSIYLEGTATHTLTSTASGTTFNSCQAATGAAISVMSGADATVTMCSIQQCDATFDGGAVSAEDGANIDLVSMSLSNNSATGNGGHCWVTGGASLTTSETNISGGTAARGGGAYSEASGLFTMVGGSIDNCSANTSGGAMHTATGGESSLSDVTSNGNSADDGGHLYFEASTIGLVVDCDFVDADTNGTGTGGFVRVEAASPQLIGCSFSDSDSGSDAVSGGAFYISSGGTPILKGVTITGCSSSGNGGAVYLEGGANPNFEPQTGPGGTIRNTFSRNTTTGRGGHMFFAQDAQGSIDSVDMDQGSAGPSGGSIHISSDATPTFSDCQIGDSSAIDGGVISILDGQPTFNGGSHLYTGTASNDGGIVWISGEDAILNCAFAELYDGSAVRGGIVAVINEANCVWSDVQMSDGIATTNGGGLYIENAVVDWTNGGCDGHIAAVYGGGIYTIGSGALTLSGVAVSQNDAAEKGGGLYSAPYYDDSDVYHENDMEIMCLAGTSFTNNMATYKGGGMYVQHDDDPNDQLLMFDTSISSNQSDIEGGGIALYRGSIIWSGGEVSNNVATGNSYDGFGGGVFALSTDMSLEGLSIHSNWAINGGGVHFEHGQGLTMSNSSVYNNTASKGGGVKIWDCGTPPQFTHTAFVGNHATTGEALHIDNSDSFVDILSCLFDGHIDEGAGDDGAAMLLGAGITARACGSWFATNSDLLNGQGTILDSCQNYHGPYPGDWNGNMIHDWDEIVRGDVLDVDNNWIPDGFEADLDGSTTVDTLDLVALISVWGTETWRFDIDGDGLISLPDLLLLLHHWG